MNNQVVSGILLGAAIVASAWVVSKSLERSSARWISRARFRSPTAITSAGSFGLQPGAIYCRRQTRMP